MPISRKSDYARMIAMMVRREEVVFEPGDRVALDVAGKRYAVGSVYYDYDIGKMCYTLYDGIGKRVQGRKGPFLLDANLTSSELLRVSAKVSDYVEKSIGRGKNVMLIEDLVRSSPDMSVVFTQKPRLAVDLSFDGNVEMLEADKIYDVSLSGDEKRDIWLAGKTAEGRDFSFPLISVSDVGLAAVRDRVLESVKALSLDQPNALGKVTGSENDWRVAVAKDIAMQLTAGTGHIDRESVRAVIMKNNGTVRDLGVIRHWASESARAMLPDGNTPRTKLSIEKSLDFWLDPKFHALKSPREKGLSGPGL